MKGKGIDAYCRSYLQQWDKRATLRARSRYQPTALDVQRDVFPRALQPLASHPAVIARGEEVIHELLVRTSYQWQTDVAALEVNVVAELCGRLANRAVRFALPDSARQVALTIGTDEMYHAYAAREFIDRVRQLTGIDPGPTAEAQNALDKALAHVQRLSPREYLPEAEIMVLCFAEHFVTEELFGLSKDANSKDAGAQCLFQVVAREHLMDEGRHQQFFERLLLHMWREIDAEARAGLGRLLPGFLDVFLRDLDQFMAKAASVLDFLGVDRETGRRIADEAFDAQYGPPTEHKSEMKAAQHCLDLVRSSGMLDDATTRQALMESGWIGSER
jgi:hypothetical protein